MNRSICRILTALVLIAFVAITVAADHCTDADKMTLKKMDKAWGDANRARDKAALGAILSDHFANFNLSGTTGKKVAMGNLDGPAPPANGNVVISDNYIISCSGNTAVMTHRVEIRTKDAVNYSRSVHVFQKSGNRWQVLSSVSHPMNEVGNLFYHNYTALNAFKNHDVKWFNAHTDDGYLGINADGKMSTKADLLKNVKDYKATFDFIKIEQIFGILNGNTGWIVVTSHAKGKNADGTAFEGRRRYSRTYIKKHGKWLLRSSHFSQLKEPETP